MNEAKIFDAMCWCACAAMVAYAVYFGPESAYWFAIGGWATWLCPRITWVKS